MKLNNLLLIGLMAATFTSCVSTKTLEAEKAKYAQLSGDYLAMQAKYRELQDVLKKCNFSI